MRDHQALMVPAPGRPRPDGDEPDVGVTASHRLERGRTGSLPLRLAVELPADPLSAAMARALVRSLAPRLSPDRLRRAELVVSEVVTNAVRHAPGATAEPPIRLELTVGPDRVEGRIHDRGAPFTPGRRPDRPDEPGGFGLFVVSRLTTDWSLTHDGTGNVITFVV